MNIYILWILTLASKKKHAQKSFLSLCSTQSYVRGPVIPATLLTYQVDIQTALDQEKAKRYVVKN